MNDEWMDEGMESTSTERNISLNNDVNSIIIIDRGFYRVSARLFQETRCDSLPFFRWREAHQR